VDFARLREIDELFAVRWEAFALASLSDGPLRYRQLWRAIKRHAQADIKDTTATRLLKKLTRAGLVAQTRIGGRHFVYSLTPQGEAVVRRIGGLIDAMDLLDDAARPPEVEAER
jgi:DNA-binding HxlR family transcriptional regulator